MHEFSAAGPGSSALTALPTLGLLDRVHDYDCGALGSKALSERCFRPFASKTRDSGLLSGLESQLIQVTNRPSETSRKPAERSSLPKG